MTWFRESGIRFTYIIYMSKNKIEVIINAPSEKVWRAITEKEQISKWLLPTDDFELKPGNVSTMTWQNDEQKVTHTYRIKEIIREKKLVLQWNVTDFPGDTIITYELEESDGKTKLTFTLSGFEGKAFETKEQSREEDINGWRGVIEKTLREYVESAK